MRRAFPAIMPALASGIATRAEAAGLAFPLCARGVEKSRNPLERVARGETPVEDGGVVVATTGREILDRPEAAQPVLFRAEREGRYPA